MCIQYTVAQSKRHLKWEGWGTARKDSKRNMESKKQTLEFPILHLVPWWHPLNIRGLR